MSAGWQLATDWRSVHDLVLRSDQAAGVRSDTPVPVRDPDSTRRLVEEQRCHVCLGADGQPLATVTLTPDPPFDPLAAVFTTVTRPLYQRRLAVDPHRGPELAWLGAQAVLFAQDAARHTGATAIRCEVNTRMHEVIRLLRAAGYRDRPPTSTGADQGIDIGWLEWLATT